MAGDPKTAAPEIRRNEDGTLDEVVASDCEFHLERMDTGQWWMSIRSGGAEMHVTLYTPRGAKIIANVMEVVDVR